MLATKVSDVDMNGLRTLGDELKGKLVEGVVVLASALDGKVSISAIIVSDYQVSKIRLGESFQFLKKEDDDMINLYGTTSEKKDMFEITEAFDLEQLNLFNFISGSIL